MRHPVFRLIVGPLLLAALSATGCTRSEYRRAADREAGELVHEKSNDPRWGLPGFTIDVDPRSRYFDPYDPDKPPMPPDDPVAHQFMHCVDGMKGWKGWHRNGDIPQLENPGWRDWLDAELSKDNQGRYQLTLDKAVELAIRHSPDYQEQLETLYLSALDVSTERFRFDVQFFGGNFTEFQHLGSERPGGESNTLTTTTDFQLRKRFATAGELLVGFANSTVWEFFGPNKGVTTSVLNFSLVQPLLRAGGRVIALEQLTIAERGLLANLRAFARYRMGHYTEVAIGELGVSEPQRRGGFFGGTGLTGFSGQGSAGFGGVGDVTGFGRGGFGTAGGAATGGGAGFAGGGAGQVGGFVGLLQQLQQINNTEESLRLQLRTLALLEANLEAGLIDIAQVDQYRQNIETERANLLQARNTYQSSLDDFCRRTLGLPPDLPILPDPTLIRQFQFIDPAISRLQNDLTQAIDEFGKLELEPPPERLTQAFQRIAELRGQMATVIDVVPQNLADLESRAAGREMSMTESERSLFQGDRARLSESLQSLQTRFAKTATQLQALKEGLTAENRRKTADEIVALLTEMSNIVNELSLIQARARLEMITIEPVYLKSDVALDIARANRLDWMNNRAALVDTWRLIEFNANALKSDFTVRFSGDLQTLPGDNPVAFRDETGSLRASFEFDPPFTRLVERNNFRQQLIEYQQDRRQLIQFEDQVNQTLRLILRDIERLAVSLEIQRRAVAIAIRRVDQTRETLNAPVPAALPGQPPQALGPTSAQNLLFALSDLRNTQNNLMSVWLNYLAARMRLYRELGVMRLDERGVWIEEPLEMAVRATQLECPLPPSVPDGWIQDNVPQEKSPNAPGPNLLPVPPSPAAPEAQRKRDFKSATVPENLDVLEGNSRTISTVSHETVSPKPSNRAGLEPSSDRSAGPSPLDRGLRFWKDKLQSQPVQPPVAPNSRISDLRKSGVRVYPLRDKTGTSEPTATGKSETSNANAGKASTSASVDGLERYLFRLPAE
ncbi:MAG: hypothetical protein WD648_15925 [Planctomycetaceae bacterium]